MYTIPITIAGMLIIHVLLYKLCASTRVVQMSYRELFESESYSKRFMDKVIVAPIWEEIVFRGIPILFTNNIFSPIV